MRARARWPEVLAALAGLSLVGSLFLRWWSVEGGDGGVTGVASLGPLDVIVVLAGIAGVALFLVAATQVSQAVPIATASLAALPALVALVAMVGRTIFAPEIEDIGASRGPGVWLALASAAVLLGAVLASMRDERIGVDGPPVDATTLPSPQPPPA